MHNQFLIDKITNSLESIKDGKIYPTEVLPISSADLKPITKKNNWKFNWKKESKMENRQLFKIVIQNEEEIQGLLSLEIMDKFVEMHLIESAPHNYGRKKQFYGVAPNLVAFACKTSFELGFEGYVSFTAKTVLVQHYIEKIGAELTIRNRMAITTESARKLVNSYYKDHEI